MAASSNESFGLKIGLSVSIALTVILLVLVYFLNQNYNEAVAAKAKSDTEKNDAQKLQAANFGFYTQLKESLGYSSIEEIEAVKSQSKKDQDAIKEEIRAIQAETAASVTEFQKAIAEKGGDAGPFEAVKLRARELADQYLNNPDQSYKASLARLKDLTVNQSKLNRLLALNYIDVKRDLDRANDLNAAQKKVVEDAAASAKAELADTIKKDEEARQSLVADNQAKAEQLATLETKLVNQTNEMASKTGSLDKIIAQNQMMINDLKTQAAKSEKVMTRPAGRVTFVDSGANQVRVNINKRQGVRNLMRFTIFDKNAVGITSDKPKAAIELIHVGDPQAGENDSLARIVQTYDPNDPIRYNDFIFSVGWSYDHPQRFDLIGKLDINRDGRDDRAELIRMIEASGGVVEFDLPPPNVDRSPGQAAVARAFARLNQPVPQATGRAAGKISALAYAYVIDTRTSLAVNERTPDLTREDTAFVQEMSQATKEATDNNVRPLPIEKMLNMLGYDYSMPIEGRRERANKQAIQELIKPKPPTSEAPAPAPAPTNP